MGEKATVTYGVFSFGRLNTSIKARKGIPERKSPAKAKDARNYRIQV